MFPSRKNPSRNPEPHSNSEEKTFTLTNIIERALDKDTFKQNFRNDFGQFQCFKKCGFSY